jgi:hypothetical protein
MPHTAKSQRFFHLHLVSDATGETLTAVANAATVQYADFQPIQHVHALVRNPKQLDRVVRAIEAAPGVVLFTLVNEDLRSALESRCREAGVPSISVLDPVMAALASYLNAKSKPLVGGQHALNAEYFKRIDALNFTMMHDDGQHVENLDHADVILIGISRTSKTPTSIYLANRGIKTANVPLVLGMPLPPQLEAATRPLVVGLIASTERILQIRRNRLLSLKEGAETHYVDKAVIAEELTFARKLCARHDWPVIDVTRRSIEETAAAVLTLYHEKSQP